MQDRSRTLSMNCGAAALMLALAAGCGHTGRVGDPVDVASNAASPSGAQKVAALESLTNQPARIMVNQHGIGGGQPIRAALITDEEAPIRVSLRDSDGQVAAQTLSEPFGLDPQSGFKVHRITIDSADAEGESFTLQSGDAVSDAFSLGQRPNRALMQDSLSYFYQARYAEPVEDRFVPVQSPPLSRPAGHVDAAHSCFSGTDERGANWPGCGYSLDVTGGWYDAGDHGQYAVNTGVATWAMLNMAETDAQAAQDMCRPLLGDRSLSMQEAGNNQADILDEARRGIDNLLSVQITSDEMQGLARGQQTRSEPLSLTLTNAQGMVHHKTHGIHWPGGDIAPQDDDIPRRLYPPSTAATLHLAGVGAMCARLFADIDPPYANQCLSAARRAYAAAQRVPDAYAYGNFTGGGGYGDTDIEDEFGWAATELWLTTGEAEYADDVQRLIGNVDIEAGMSWATVGGQALVSLASQPESDTRPLVKQARAVLTRWADRLAGEAETTAFMIPKGSTRFTWGSNGDMMNRGIILGAAYRLSGKAAYRQGAQDTIDYVLGRNPLGISYVSGYGARAMENPHHRFWRGGLDDNRPFPPPGALSGGPNNVNFTDPIGSTMRGRCIGMTCWVDDFDTYSMNEVAINWNAPLAWVAHFLDQQESGCNQPPLILAD